jgi:hypothetical protein
MRERGDIVLFVVRACLALILVRPVFFPRGSDDVERMIMLYPFALIGVITALVKYRLWANRLFWMLLIISGFAVFVGSQNGVTEVRGNVGNALFATLTLAPVFAVPLWQLAMLGARILKAREELG